MTISAVQNVNFNRYNNNLNFGQRHEEDREYKEPSRKHVSPLRAIPLATMIAMSPMISSNVQAQTIYTFSGEKIIAKDTIQDLNGKNKVLLYLSSDGNDNDAERLAFNIRRSPRKYGTRSIYDPDLNKNVQVRVYENETQYIDSLVLLKTQHTDGDITCRYFVSGPCIVKNTAFYAENGELYKDFPPRLEREDQNSRLEVSKNTFDALKEVFPPSLVKEEYIKLEGSKAHNGDAIEIDPITGDFVY